MEILVSLLFTLIEYSLFPIIWAFVRCKAISAKKYRWICFGVNLAVNLVMHLLVLSSPSGFYSGAFLLWTVVFTAIGVKILKNRNMIESQHADQKDGGSGNAGIASSEVLFEEPPHDEALPAGEQNEMIPSVIERTAENATCNTEKERIKSAPVAKFCRKCGYPLGEGAMYCRSCGTKVETISSCRTTDTSVTSNVAAGNANRAFSIEGEDEDSIDYGCAVERAAGLQQVFSPQFKLDLKGIGVSPKIRRAFIFIEDGEWQKADEYLERVLDDEPESAYAYLGKLLVDLNLNNASQLIQHTEATVQNPHYKRALRYSDGALKQFLESLLK